jgi:hypothetical protein
MANFNKVKQGPQTTTSHEGGKVYEKTVVDAWVNMLFSSFLEDKFYESAEDQRNRFIELTDRMAADYGYAFVAKAAVFARNELGMRSISQLVAAWLNDKTFENKRLFYRNFMRRPDDPAEIFAAIDFLGEKRSHALIRGAADYLRTIKLQTLAKYKLNSRTYNMYDLINITHAYSKAIDDYKHGELELADTWEVNISGAENQEERDREWKRLVDEHKLGYMALIRNLNNILSSDEIDRAWVADVLVPQIKDENAIRKSLMFPYRFYTAYRSLRVRNIAVVSALEDAFITASKFNMPTLEGQSAIILDVSGSMEDPISKNSYISIKQAGACFAVALALNNSDCILIKFGNKAKQFKINSIEDPFRIVDQMCDNDNCGWGTEINPAFECLHQVTGSDNLQRIFVISDMQVMDNSSYPYYDYFRTNYGYEKKSARDTYNKYFHRIPLYSFDLGNYHTQIMAPADHMHYITSLSDQVFKFIGLLESGINLVDYINSYSYC